MLEAKTPSGPLEQKWSYYKGHCKLVNPANKRKLEVIVVGTGLAGASAAASLGELGYKVKAFCFQDSPRRAHSIAAQGGINAMVAIGQVSTSFRAKYDAEGAIALKELVAHIGFPRPALFVWMTEATNRHG